MDSLQSYLAAPAEIIPRVWSKWWDYTLPDLTHALDLLSATCFMFETADDAKRGEKAGGSGFIVAVPVPGRDDLIARYAVSNWHAVCQRGASIIRVTNPEGRTEIVETDPSEWEWIPGGQDVCAIPLALPKNTVWPAIPTSFFAVGGMASDYWVGDDVFMVGRFIDLGGKATNKPALRFGHISMVDAEIRQLTGFEGQSIILDMHSRTGFSGSPVFVYRSGAESNPNFLINQGVVTIDGRKTGQWRTWGNWNSTEIRLLGLHWGQFPERWELELGKRGAPENDTMITEGAYVKGLSGMTCIVPAKQILDVLNLPPFLEMRQQIADRHPQSPIAD